MLICSLNSDLEFDLTPFSQRKKTRPSELVGPWKVFEVGATPIYDDDNVAVESNSAPYVYLCRETLKKRSLPESSGYFREEEVLDMQDVTVLSLPGDVTSYVDVSNDGILTIGVGCQTQKLFIFINTFKVGFIGQGLFDMEASLNANSS
ncbi:hypothetical protein V6N13_093409 [Hibiscus sabdariffa]